MRLRTILAGLMVCGAAFGQAGLRRAPGFSLPDVQMRQYDLNEYRGKVVIVELMQVGCPHCQEVSISLEHMRQKYGPKVQILSVVNPPARPDEVSAYTAKHSLHYPILFDSGQMAISYTRATPENPRVSVPAIYVVDGNGMIRNELMYEDGRKDQFSEASLSALVDKALTPAAIVKK